jgi:hypothetical protein
MIPPTPQLNEKLWLHQHFSAVSCSQDDCGGSDTNSMQDVMSSAVTSGCALHRTRRFITMFRRACHCTHLHQLNLPHIVTLFNINFNISVSCVPYCILPNGLLILIFYLNAICISCPSHACCVHHPTPSSCSTP